VGSSDTSESLAPIKRLSDSCFSSPEPRFAGPSISLPRSYSIVPLPPPGALTRTDAGGSFLRAAHSLRSRKAVVTTAHQILIFLYFENECYVWLCVTNLLCAAVEALADFEFDGDGMDRFSQFVMKYVGPEFDAPTLRLDEPRYQRRPAVTPAEDL
jgi:hypothetical protein